MNALIQPTVKHTYTGNKYNQFLAIIIIIIDDRILACNFKSCKETYLLPHQQDFKKKPRGLMLSSPLKVWGEFFPKQAFHWGMFLEKFVWGKFKNCSLCVNGDVGSQFDLGTSLLKRFAWEDWGQEETSYGAFSQLYLWDLEDQKGWESGEVLK